MHVSTRYQHRVILGIAYPRYQLVPVYFSLRLRGVITPKANLVKLSVSEHPAPSRCPRTPTHLGALLLLPRHVHRESSLVKPFLLKEVLKERRLPGDGNAPERKPEEPTRWPTVKVLRLTARGAERLVGHGQLPYGHDVLREPARDVALGLRDGRIVRQLPSTRCPFPSTPGLT